MRRQASGGMPRHPDEAESPEGLAWLYSNLHGVVCPLWVRAHDDSHLVFGTKCAADTAIAIVYRTTYPLSRIRSHYVRSDDFSNIFRKYCFRHLLLHTKSSTFRKRIIVKLHKERKLLSRAGGGTSPMKPGNRHLWCTVLILAAFRIPGGLRDERGVSKCKPFSQVERFFSFFKA